MLKLDRDLVEQVLQKLELSGRPETNLEGLSQVYGRWCRRIPFDNIQKRFFYSGPARGPAPGYDSEDFFQKWLAYGSGGTCWANSNAVHDLLEALGFAVTRAAGTMLVTPDVIGPTHGTVVATIEQRQYLVDGSMQTEHPVPVTEGPGRDATHPAERVLLEYRGGKWYVLWHPPHLPDGLQCRLEEFGVSRSRFNQYHERTRTRSPFNASLHVRINQPGRVAALAFGQWATLGHDGKVIRTPLSAEQRVQTLVEEFGIAEELATRLPDDEPLPAN